ncbi:SCO family protein [Hymenobacter cellulosivorans]|uniref:SCO family protein n=1 Tax=Hymenobacter cellulosivorans TaxID=2932249 RepID=A0ABY4F9U5_9BACT|nr:SCO family protein [Hymenobacter cellulosivorans]UOQ52803.1 SCO family protein [Hymenobacter cellulosivorans]
MRPKQTLVLGLILLLPVLAFLFLKTFGTNRFALPTYLPDRVDSTLVGGKWQRDTVFHTLRNFQLPSQSGRVVSQQDLKGGLYVANFFFATCPGACPRVSSQMMRVQEKFRKEPRVKLVSYTVDPAHDSVAVLARYAEQYSAIAGKWFFLTGNKAELYRLATEEFRLPAPSGAAPGIVHSQNLYLVDRNHQVRGIYDGTKPREVERLITEISVLLYTYDHDKSGQ